MKSPQFQAFLAIATVLLTVGTTPTWADDTDPYREGTGARVEVATRGEGGGLSGGTRLRVGAHADIAVVPIPGGSQLNGTRFDLVLGFAPDGRSDIDLARAQLLRWQHLHAIGVERDRDHSTSIAVDLVGIHIPVRVSGETGSRSWAILRAGANVGLRWLSEDLGAQRDAAGPSIDVSCRMDETAQITDRVALRAFQEALYRAVVDDPASVSRSPAYLQTLALRAGIRLTVDVTDSPPIRRVARTNPVTGARTTRTLTNPGQRSHIYAGVEAEGRPIDDINQTPYNAIFSLGFTHEN